MSADPVVALFAARLRRMRHARSWSLAALAEKSGVSSAGLSNIENSKADPGLSTVARIARAFDIPLGEMVSDSPCGQCDGKPPAGFICADCGRKGETGG